MLTAGKMVGFVLTKDYDAARAFYEGKLGFAFVALTPFALIMRAGENLVRIVKNGGLYSAAEYGAGVGSWRRGGSCGLAGGARRRD
jgi:catechol 2,3-dioxygenase-like lactoylglutathione lyase family enzyme